MNFQALRNSILIEAACLLLLTLLPCGLAARKGTESALLQSLDVSLAQPVSAYSMSTRAGKYGALFIGLAIMAAFMFEPFRKLRMHPVQYGLVGLSIALFLLLLALSEKVAFGMAYAGAASASVLLLATYFSAVPGGWHRGGVLRRTFGGAVRRAPRPAGLGEQGVCLVHCRSSACRRCGCWPPERSAGMRCRPVP